MERKYNPRPLFFKYWLGWAIPLLIIIAIKLSVYYPFFLEKYYAAGIYPFISKSLRWLTGWFNISVGDLLYVLVGLYLFKLIINQSKIISRGKITLSVIWLQILKLTKKLLWIYIVFNIFWGLNYNRAGIAYQLKLSVKDYSIEDLKSLICDIETEMNVVRLQLGDSNYVYPADTAVFEQAYRAYKSVEKAYPFLKYQNFSVKSSMLTNIVSNAGYSGYYNPFSGEAQLNTDMPSFYLPFVVCHEMAHQIGYGSESEANFVSFIVGYHSNNLLFQYAALYELFAAANNELLVRDFWAAIINLKDLNPLVKRDRRIFRNYILGKQNYVEPIVKNVYDQFLKANDQKKGISSYEEIVGWAIAYRKKYRQ